MSESLLNIITIILLTVLPLTFLLLHTFLSARKSVLWCIPVPVIWNALGIWMMYVLYKDMGYNMELLVFFLAGDVILAAITVLIRRIKNNR